MKTLIESAFFHIDASGRSLMYDSSLERLMRRSAYKLKPCSLRVLPS